MILLPLHPSVLKPNLHLTLGETHRVGYLHTPASGQIAVKVEFFFELECLLAGVGSARPLGHSSIVTGID